MEYEQSYLEATQTVDLSEANWNPELRIWTHEGLASFVQSCQQVDFWGLPEHPPEEYLWLIDRGEFIGRLFILHWLNQYRLENDGQVDYWIRDSKRRQGYGRLILRLALERFRQLGLERVLISCREDNTGSRRIIESSGGIYESSIKDYDYKPGLRRRYWIELT
jgi:predicted acetyltransferase